MASKFAQPSIDTPKHPLRVSASLRETKKPASLRLCVKPPPRPSDEPPPPRLCVSARNKKPASLRETKPPAPSGKKHFFQHFTPDMSQQNMAFLNPRSIIRWYGEQ